MRVLLILMLAVLAAAGCRCAPDVTRAPPPSLAVAPTRLVLAPTYLGQAASGEVSVVNEGGRADAVAVTIDGPFTTDVAQLTLGQGAQERVEVRFAATAVGPASGRLRIGALTVPVEAEALAVPECAPSGVCVEVQGERTNLGLGSPAHPPVQWLESLGSPHLRCA